MDRTFYGTAAESQLQRELHAVLERRIAAVNLQWDSGVFDPGADPVTDDFHGTQYAPWYPDEIYAADAAGWQEGSRDAARSGQGQGWHWTVRDANFLPRSTTETIAVFTVVHHWADPSTAPGEAVFLETWVLRDGSWRIRRHTAEKR